MDRYQKAAEDKLDGDALHELVSEDHRVVLRVAYEDSNVNYVFGDASGVFITQRQMRGVKAILDVFEGYCAFENFLRLSDVEPYELDKLPYSGIAERIREFRMDSDSGRAGRAVRDR